MTQALVPVLGGAGGGVLAIVGADKLGMNPTHAAWTTAAAGTLAALGTRGWMRQAAAGVGAAGACLAALQLVTAAKASHATATAKAVPAPAKRQAGEYVTHTELNDAIGRLADGQKQTCDVVTAIREEVKKVLAEQQRPPARLEGWGGAATRQAAEDDYMRNAYGSGEDEARNYGGDDDYMRNAYGGIL